MVQDDLHGRFEAVKHPNVLVVISVRDFGVGSFKTLRKLREICNVATVWGGRILVGMPCGAKAWEGNSAFARFCVDYNLEYVIRADEEMAFATNDKSVNWALHDGDWCLSEGTDEARKVFWAEDEWGDDSEVSRIHALIGNPKSCEEPTRLQSMGGVSCGTAPAMPCGPVTTKKHRQKLVTATYRLPLAVARKVKR